MAARLLRAAVTPTARARPPPPLAFLRSASPFLARLPVGPLHTPVDARRAFASSSSTLFWPFSSSPTQPPPAPVAPAPHFDDTPAVPEPVPKPPVEPVVEPESVVEAASQFYLQTKAGLVPSGTLDLSSLASAWGPHPIMRLQSLFLQLHEAAPFLGGPVAWCVLIPSVTLLLRSILFWFQVRAQRNAAKMAVIQPQMLANMAKLKAAKKIGDVPGQQAAQMETQQLMRDHGVNPISNLVFPLSQAAVFMCMFFALRGLAGAGLDSMATEGAWWFTDLTQSDPYYILPLMSTGLTLASLEAGLDSTTQVQTSTTKNMKLVFRGLLVVSLPFIAYFPAALLVYWVTNNFVSLVQSLFLRQPVVRTFFGIPVVPKKPQPGEKGYIPEPTFAEAFRDMQVGAGEKWAETSERAAAKQAEANARKLEDAMPAGYSPRKGFVSPQMRILEEATEDVSAPAASPQTAAMGAPADEKAKRVLAARLRRLKKQGRE